MGWPKSTTVARGSGVAASVLLRKGRRDANEVRPGHEGPGGPAGREHRDEYDTEWAAMRAIAARLGMSAETLRQGVRQVGVDDGQAAGVSPAECRELRELREKNRELEQTVIILGRTDYLAP